jgi:dsRNA-specific ribonuclease
MFEPPKILGDVFESLIGAIFIDGGIESVIEVYQHLLSPFILFTAKYSKKLYKEPKDDFNSLANFYKIRPDWRHVEIEVDSIDNFITELSLSSDPTHAYS